MTREDLKKQRDELQDALNKLGSVLIEKDPQGIVLITKKAMVEERLEKNDHE